MNDRDPEYQVDQAINAVFMSIAELDRLRMKNDTADFVLREYEQIAGATMMLDDLASDINTGAQNYKRAAE